MFLRLALLFLALLAIPVRASSPDLLSAQVASLRALQAEDARVATVAYRLATRGKVFCKFTQPQTGFLLHSLSQYDADYRVAARSAFGLSDALSVLVVVRGSAAERAGIQAGDDLLKVNQTPLRDAPLGKRSAVSVVEGSRLVRQATEKPDPPLLTLRRKGQVTSLPLNAERGCASRVELVPGSKLNAKADGEVLQLTTAVLSEARDDDELAFIIAHEMAHNGLGHPQMLRASGWKKSRVLETEIEADQVGLRLMHLAGYDPHAGARFWARFGKKTGYGIFSDGTHQRTKARVRLLEDEAKALTQ
jgi:membrane-associated protease RseP (regulator of RpoE activity)